MRTILALAMILSACGGKPPPETRYYQLALPEAHGSGGDAIVIEPLATDGVYDDERMVYRTSPYRLDYYDYHRWGAPPGQMIASYLGRALEGRGFRVVPEGTDDHALVLTGRVAAIEEVDRDKTKWIGRISLELVVRDAKGKVVWTGRFDETAPMPVQSPEGLAQAITAAMQRISERVATSVRSPSRPAKVAL